MLAEIFGPDLLIVLIVIAVVLFGGAAIPKLARNLGSAQSEFKKGMSEGHGETATAAATSTPAVAAAADDVALKEQAAREAMHDALLKEEIAKEARTTAEQERQARS